MNLQKRRTGGPNLKFWEDAQIIGLFDPIRRWLTENCRDAIQNERLTNRSLAQLCLQILLVQDDNFGSLTKEPRGGFSLQYKLPLILFQDFSPNGSICHLIKAALNLKKDRQWSRLPLQSTSNEARQLELWTVMLNEVIDMNLWQYPKIYFHSTVSEESAGNMQVIVSRFGGEVVDSPHDASHIIYPASTTASVAKDEIRPVIQSDGAFLLHWKYSAISQQLWTSELPEDCNLTVEEALSPKGPWEVDSRWLINTDLYREWTPEEDYLLSDQLFAKEKQLPFTWSRKHFTVHQLLNPCPPSNNPRKRSSPSPPSLSQSAPSEKKRKESSKKSLNKMKLASPIKSLSIEIEKDPFLGLPEVSAVNKVDVVDMESPSAAAMLQAHVKQLKNTAFNSRSNLLLLDKHEAEKEEKRQSAVLFIPEKAFWYDHESVHSIEMEAFPQYFPKKSKKVNCSKPRQLYVAYRNFMIDSYRCNPSRLLSFSDCAKALPVSCIELLAIYNFLNHWGLINSNERVFNSTFESDSMSTLASALLDLENSADDPSVLLVKKTEWHSTSHIVRLEEESNEKEIKSDSVAEKLLTPRVKKFSNISSGTSRSSHQSSAHQNWTDEETLLLLKGVELYEDDWNSIAGHVGTRTEDDCIQQMLRLPIEDPYLDANPVVMSGSMGDLGLPFARSGNPVMAMIAFLASTVSPKIVSSAAKSALRVYCNNLESIAQMKQLKKSSPIINDDKAATEKKDEINIKCQPSTDDSSNDVVKTNDDEVTIVDQKDLAEESTEDSYVDSNAKLEVVVEDKKKTTTIDEPGLTEAEQLSIILSQSNDSPNEFKAEDSKHPTKECEGSDPSHLKASSDKENQIVDSADKTTDEVEETSTTKFDETSSEDNPPLPPPPESTAESQRLFASLEENHELTRKAVEAALKSAMNKARDLASIEERKLRVMVMQLLNVQMNKIDIKMKELQQLDDLLAKEHSQILQQKEQVIADRKSLHSDLSKLPAKQANDAATELTVESTDKDVLEQI